MSKIRSNFLKEKLANGLPVIGTWNTLNSPQVTEVLAKSGFDFIIIDYEHGPPNFEKIIQFVNACEIYNCSPIIRIPTNSNWMTLQALDQGAHGVMVPGISDFVSANDFIASMKYYPRGNRGFTPFTKAGGFTNRDNDSYPSNANKFVVSSIIIENKEGLDNLDQILKIKELDIVYFGAYDLSQSLGFPGDVKNPKVIYEIENAVKKVTSSGKVAGGFVPQNKEDIKWLLDLGMKFITYNVDSDLLYNSSRNKTIWFEKNFQ